MGGDKLERMVQRAGDENCWHAHRKQCGRRGERRGRWRGKKGQVSLKKKNERNLRLF